MIDQKGNLELNVLDPTEAELLSKLLECDKNINEIKAAIEKVSPLIISTLENFLIQEFPQIKSLNNLINYNNRRDITSEKDLCRLCIENGPEAIERFLKDALSNWEEEISKDKYVGASAYFIFNFDKMMSTIPIDFIPGISYWTAIKLLGSERKFNLALMTPELGIVKTGRQGVEAKITDSPQYVELVTQAKFFNGVYNNYTKAEQKYLSKWIKEQGSDNMLALFKNILRARPDEALIFEGSVLQNIFKTIETI